MKPFIRTTPRTHHADATYTSACILRAETSSTEPCGGDSGHGARAVLKLTDMASVCWTVEVVDEDNNVHALDCPRSVSIEVAGDCEQGVLLAALEQMVATMRAAGVEPVELPKPEVGLFGTRFAQGNN
jgi:hypothetical protein